MNYLLKGNMLDMIGVVNAYLKAKQFHGPPFQPHLIFIVPYFTQSCPIHND